VHENIASQLGGGGGNVVAAQFVKTGLLCHLQGFTTGFGNVGFSLNEDAI
jgi:hypothetical protein